MIKSCLILVPHPDDEINLAGGILQTLVDNNISTTVVICTNGDYIPEHAQKRYKEAKNVQEIFGYNELIFLGYGDKYKDKHLYDSKNNEIVVSNCGRNETYCAGKSSEFRYKRDAYHNKYTRANYIQDLHDLILDKKSDLIICVDVDRHLEHRCLSLLFDECIGNILKSSDYRPIILKGFAYLGVWRGVSDFYNRSICGTKPTFEDGLYHKLNTFPYNWNDRISIRNSKSTTTLNLWRNLIFRSLLANKSQHNPYPLDFCAIANFTRIANPDSCFWFRDTNNLALSAEISVSSGFSSPLNDFVLSRPNSVSDTNIWDNLIAWTPESNDACPTIDIKFKSRQVVKMLKLYKYGNVTPDDISLTFDSGAVAEINGEESNVITILLEDVYTNEISIKINPRCLDLAVNEIECFDHIHQFDWNSTPFERYIENNSQRNVLLIWLSKILFNTYIRIIIHRNILINRIRRRFE